VTGHFQIAIAKTGVLPEPDTYYPTREQAEAAVKRIEQTVPDLRGHLIIVPEKENPCT